MKNVSSSYSIAFFCLLRCSFLCNPKWVTICAECVHTCEMKLKLQNPANRLSCLKNANDNYAYTSANETIIHRTILGHCNLKTNSPIGPSAQTISTLEHPASVRIDLRVIMVNDRKCAQRSFFYRACLNFASHHFHQWIPSLERLVAVYVRKWSIRMHPNASNVSINKDLQIAGHFFLLRCVFFPTFSAYSAIESRMWLISFRLLNISQAFDAKEWI